MGTTVLTRMTPRQTLINPSVDVVGIDIRKMVDVQRKESNVRLVKNIIILLRNVILEILRFMMLKLCQIVLILMMIFS